MQDADIFIVVVVVIRSNIMRKRTNSGHCRVEEKKKDDKNFLERFCCCCSSSLSFSHLLEKYRPNEKVTSDKVQGELDSPIKMGCDIVRLTHSTQIQYDGQKDKLSGWALIPVASFRRKSRSTPLTFCEFSRPSKHCF